MKLPALQFYPGDWRKDPGVQALSRHDRSVWFDMLLIMHESDERGVLLLAGKPMPDDALARILNLDNQEVKQILSTLLTYGVASEREDDSAIYSRRMVRDEKLIQTRREAGKKGGNPLLLNQKDNQNPTTRVKQIPTPSSSSSSSSSISPSTTVKENIPPNPQGGINGKSRSELKATLQIMAEGIYGHYPKKVGKDAAVRSIIKALKYETRGSLTEAVQAYAKAVVNSDRQFIPNPATWFNQGRYNDDRSEWGDSATTEPQPDLLGGRTEMVIKACDIPDDPDYVEPVTGLENK